MQWPARCRTRVTACCARKRAVDGEKELLVQAVFEIQPGKLQLESVVKYQGLGTHCLPSSGL